MNLSNWHSIFDEGASPHGAEIIPALQITRGPLSLLILIRIPLVAKMYFNLSLLQWKSVDGTYVLYHWIFGSLADEDEIALTIWVWSNIFCGYCVPRLVWDVGHLDWFFSVSFRNYLALILFIRRTSISLSAFAWSWSWYFVSVLSLSLKTFLYSAGVSTILCSLKISLVLSEGKSL